jgi:hypothetical protein
MFFLVRFDGAAPLGAVFQNCHLRGPGQLLAVLLVISSAA